MREEFIESAELPWILFLSGMDGRTLGLRLATWNWPAWYGGEIEFLGLEWEKKEYRALVDETREAIEDLYKSHAPGLIVCSSAGVCMGLRMIAEKEEQLIGMVGVNGFVKFEGREQRWKYAVSDRHRDGFFPGVNYAEKEVLPNLTHRQMLKLAMIYSSNDGSVPRVNSRVNRALLDFDTEYRFHPWAIYRALSGSAVKMGVKMLVNKWSRSK